MSATGGNSLKGGQKKRLFFCGDRKKRKKKIIKGRVPRVLEIKPNVKPNESKVGGDSQVSRTRGKCRGIGRRREHHDERKKTLD